MESQDYQKIFEETRNLHEKQLEEKLLSFANGNKQMGEEMQAMFARIDEYYDVLQDSQNDSSNSWPKRQMQKVIDLINEKDKRHVTVEEVEQMVNQEVSRANNK